MCWGSWSAGRGGQALVPGQEVAVRGLYMLSGSDSRGPGKLGRAFQGNSTRMKALLWVVFF